MNPEPQFRTEPFHYNADDLQALALLARPQWHKRLRMAAFVVIGMLLVTLAIDVALIPSDFDLVPFVLGLVAAALLFLLSDARLRATLWLKLARRGPLYSEQRIGLVPDGLSVDSTKVKSEVAWTAITDVRRVGDRLFFFVSKRFAYIAPRRAFESDAQFEAFVSAAEEQWRAAQ